MANPLWDPERLQIVGSIVQRYAEHLRPGHRVRRGIEGDPCANYRGTNAVGTVESIERNGDLITFTARMDGEEELFRGTNHHMMPDELWEIEPSFLDTFREDVERDAAQANDAGSAISLDRHTFRRAAEALETRMTQSYDTLSEQVQQLHQKQAEFQGAMTQALRHIASDLVLSSQGKTIEFCHEYADRYDATMDARQETEAAFRSSGAVGSGEVEKSSFRLMSEELKYDAKDSSVSE